MATYIRADLILVTVLVVLCCQTYGKQFTRLSSGLECPEQGYFRDIKSCKKFYYCPNPSILIGNKGAPLTANELEILFRLTLDGLECPEEMIFDEATTSCKSIFMIDSIPPECLPKKFDADDSHVGLKTGRGTATETSNSVY